jgi:hypothetical protein
MTEASNRLGNKRRHDMLALKKLIQLVVVLLTGLAVWAPSWADSPNIKAPLVQNPERVLLVGNSYLYYGDSLHNTLRRMVAADQPSMDKKLQYKSATIGGASLDHHNIDWLTTPGKIGVKEPFQLVVLQGHSAAALSKKQSEIHTRASRDAAKLIKSRGGQVALYMPHSYVAPHKQASPENIAKNRDFYVQLGNELGAMVLPIGLAFEEAYKRFPGIKLHKSYDGSHPSREGTYLAAATCYAAIYGKSPVGNAFDAFGEVDPLTIRMLQEVAQDTVQKFFGR